ncbi:hypothetical protein ALO97_200194 [Pseudomonas syringae pv. tagetis]|nr:hypothetical protein ALO98_200037 [Pseudomonas syringae pv. tagetis]RMW24996.1 hypothetical protein ALO97_200194 [Pseudomonas syringae pv. tagetis]
MTMDKAKPAQLDRWPQEPGYPIFSLQSPSFHWVCRFSGRRDLAATEACK